MKFKYVISGVIVLCAIFTGSAFGQSGSIKGKVREQNGRSLEDVLVRATNTRNKESKFEIKSDSKGEFTFAELPAGEYSLSFEKQGFKTFTTRKLEVASGDTIKLSRVIEMAREGESYSVIRGAVFHGAGFTLRNAIVTLERIDGIKKLKQDTVSQDGGEFAFRLKAEKAKYRITAMAKGFQPASVEIEIESDEVRNIAITLQQEKD
ncbi:MAG: carboxypeptidase regulatory-like domain-containing protein [Acidobacteria bacterium]|nr:carboxypeptidase regulatory-like domain-containing protein [Acidobacteriota bacterium]